MPSLLSHAFHSKTVSVHCQPLLPESAVREESREIEACFCLGSGYGGQDFGRASVRGCVRVHVQTE